MHCTATMKSLCKLVSHHHQHALVEKEHPTVRGVIMMLGEEGNAAS